VRFLYWAVTALAALVLLIFAVSNRAVVDLTLFPLPAKLMAPLYLVVMVAAIVGFVIGQAAAWIGGAKRRAEHRALRRRHDRLQRDFGQALPGPSGKSIERR
jgi:lipopolysaccharide assembly protein A